MYVMSSVMPGALASSATVKLVTIASSIGFDSMGAPVRKGEGVGALSVAHVGRPPFAGMRSRPSGRGTCSGGSTSSRRVAVTLAPGWLVPARGVFF